MSQLIWRRGKFLGIEIIDWLVWPVVAIGIACAVGVLLV
jgi:hypothetical protein